MLRYFLLLALTVCSATLGYFAGGKVASSVSSEDSSSANPFPTNREIREGGYSFINPLIECDCYEPSKLIKSVQLESDIRKYIQLAVNDNKASHVSVYFRDLNNGPWIGIDEDELFFPASLLKVPVMIAALKKAEGDINFLKKRFTFQASMDDGFAQYIKDSLRLKAGKSYTVEDLIYRMVAYSDNRALNLLTANMEVSFVDDVYRDIQLKVEGERNAYDMISVQSYSSFFRILYNASYLNKEMSEKALHFLSQSTFTEGLVSGVPESITVAHKFGERGHPDNQLHDCGIVYHNRQPYLICVMTRGKNFKELCTVISDVSNIVYKAVNER